MPHIIFKRDRYYPAHYRLDEVKNLHSLYCTNEQNKRLGKLNVDKLDKDNIEIRGLYRDTPDYCITYKRNFKKNWYYKYVIDTDTIEFDIEGEPYKCGEVVYVRDKNEFHVTNSRYRDDGGSWIYNTTLSEDCRETYSDEELEYFNKMAQEEKIKIDEYEDMVSDIEVCIMLEVDKMIDELESKVEIEKIEMGYVGRFRKFVGKFIWK